ncbi:hypothetical protein ACLIA0_12180 [Bacillaceae bacterium W0354]
MQKTNNEKGAALVVVLLTIALIMLFATVMMSNILSSAKQNEIIESDYRATHITEMGTKYMRQKVINFLETNSFSFNDADSLQRLNQYLSNIGRVQVDDEHPGRFFELNSYENGLFYKLVGYEGRTGSINLLVNGYDDTFQKEIEVTLSIRTGGGGRETIDDWEEYSNTPPPPPDPSAGQVCYSLNCDDIENSSVHLRDEQTINNKYDGLRTKDFYAEEEITTKNNINLTVDGNAVFLEELEMNNFTKLLILGNAFIYDDFSSENNPNSEFLSCGYGRFKEDVEYKGKFGVRNKAIFDEEVDFSNAVVYFGDDVVFKDEIELKNTTLTIGGNITVYVDEANSFLSDLNGTINITGNLYIYEEDRREPIVNPNHHKINYNQPAPDFNNLDGFSISCEGATLPDDGSGSGAGADLVEGNY